jgi:hypothetical protein
MRYIVKHRRGTSSQWSAPTTKPLEEGELGIEYTDDGTMARILIGGSNGAVDALAFSAVIKIVTISLPAANWVGDDSPYTQTFEAGAISGVTANSKIDLQPNIEILSYLHDEEITLTSQNDNCVVTIYAFGAKPEVDMQIQATIMGVAHTGGTDTSRDTVTANTLLDGITAHDASGQQIVGTIETYGGDYVSVHTTTLMFSSDEEFTISTKNSTKNWDGALYYSTNVITWNEWDGTTAVASAEHNGEHRIYMRGIGNSVICGSSNLSDDWSLSGSNIKCEGNIENLLDYETVYNGEHPTMGKYCYTGLFHGCDNLITAPKLPAIILTESCYLGMFNGCKSLATIPELPATTLADNCYNSMFYDCTNIKLSAVKSGEYTTAYRIPTNGTGITATNAFTSMFKNTGGTFTDIPEINTTYYTSNIVV